jgi:hypothetical protein
MALREYMFIVSKTPACCKSKAFSALTIDGHRGAAHKPYSYSNHLAG